jgi:hypothetical protein
MLFVSTLLHHSYSSVMLGAREWTGAGVLQKYVDASPSERNAGSEIFRN